MGPILAAVVVLNGFDKSGFKTPFPSSRGRETLAPEQVLMMALRTPQGIQGGGDSGEHLVEVAVAVDRLEGVAAAVVV